MERNRIDKILGSFADVRILVVGDIMLDRYLWGEVQRISPEAPVPIVNVVRESTNLGGAANVAANIVALGGNATLIGIIGDDRFAGEFKGVLGENGLVDLGLITDIDRPTTVKTRIVAGSQQVARIDREVTDEVNGALTGKILDRIKDELPRLDGIIISDYGKGVVTLKLLESLIPMAVDAGKFVAVDPKEVHFKSYRKVSVITPNHHEAGFISGRRITSDSILDQVGWQLLNELELESLLITRGEKGMALFEKDRTRTDIPVQAKTVYDVTGAGDTVIATLSVAKTAGASMKEAAYIANAAAGLAVARFGTARITAEELSETLGHTA